MYRTFARIVQQPMNYNIQQPCPINNSAKSRNYVDSFFIPLTKNGGRIISINFVNNLLLVYNFVINCLKEVFLCSFGHSET